MNSPTSPYGDPNRSELLRLVESDLKETNAVLARIIANRDAVRPAAVTIMAAIVGFGLTQEDFRLTILALVIVGFSAFVEARHDALYIQTMARARTLEHAVERFVDYLAAPDDNQRILLEAEVDRTAGLYEFGINRSFRKTTTADLAAAVRRRHSYLMYVILGVVVAGVAVAQFAASRADDDDLTPVCFDSVVATDVAEADGPVELRLVPCP